MQAMASEAPSRADLGAEGALEVGALASEAQTEDLSPAEGDHALLVTSSPVKTLRVPPSLPSFSQRTPPTPSLRACPLSLGTSPLGMTLTLIPGACHPSLGACHPSQVDPSPSPVSPGPFQGSPAPTALSRVDSLALTALSLVASLEPAKHPEVHLAVHPAVHPGVRPAVQ